MDLGHRQAVDGPLHHRPDAQHERRLVLQWKGDCLRWPSGWWPQPAPEAPRRFDIRRAASHAGNRPRANQLVPDGKVILFEEGPINDQGDMWTLRLPERTPTRFLATEFNERGGKFSPDGRWVSYVTNRSGRNEVRVCRFPGCTDAVTISSNGGAGARWHPDGRELFFVAPNRDVYAVPVTIGKRSRAGTPRRLFTAERFVEDWFDTDGERFFIVPDPPGPAPTAPPITVVEDWTSLLRTDR